jgi:hypothetical protein
LEDYPPPNPQPTPCRIWQGSVDRYGYGRVHVKTSNKVRYQQTASRWIWSMAMGPIPDGMVVRHKCDNPPCFRLSHLELGTVADNNADAVKRGHMGPPSKLSPSLLEAVSLGRQAGLTYRQIYTDWPEIRARVTLRGLAWIGKELERGQASANPPLPEGYSQRKDSWSAARRGDPEREAAAAKYAAWRTSRRTTDGDCGVGDARSSPRGPVDAAAAVEQASGGGDVEGTDGRAAGRVDGSAGGA